MILDFEDIGSIDSTAADHLIELHSEFLLSGVTIAIARENTDVLDIIERAGLADVLGSENIHPTINAYLNQ